MSITHLFNKYYYIAPTDIPTDKTYEDLLEDLAPGICLNNNFIEINKSRMIQTDLDDEDYAIFWKCMKLYDAYGKNFFSAYLSLILDGWGSFHDGIEHWFNNSIEERMPEADSQFAYLVNILHFFCIESYHGIPLSDFDKAAQNVSSLYRNALMNGCENHRAKTLAGIERKISHYFNFDEYSESVFKELFQRLTHTRTSPSVSIDEAMRIAQQAPQQMYITIFQKGGEIQYISQTIRLLQHIGDVHKRTGADSVRFIPVDPLYVDDLLIALKIHYDLPLDKIRPSVKNRKYATINQAIFAYKRGESIPKKKVLAAIETGRLRVIDLGNGQELIDKIKLHRVLFHIPEPQP